jgi:hypothetical protein
VATGHFSAWRTVASLIEAALRPDRAWLPAALAVSIVVVLSLLWRRPIRWLLVAVAALRPGSD